MAATAENHPYRRPAQPRVEDLLQAYIIDHRFRPGDRLPTEAAFCEELGVSRNAVREAMRSLQSLGILEIRHGYGAYLSDVSLPRLADGLAFWGKLLSRDGDHVLRRIAEVRRMIETALVGQVVGLLTEQDFVELREALAVIEDASTHHERAYDADRRFHEILYRPLDNWVLTGFLRALWDSTRELTGSKPPVHDLSLTPDLHRGILAALEAEDAAAATKAMHEHFDLTVHGVYS